MSNIEKLKELADALEAPMPENFKWNFQVTLDLYDYKVPECGSVGCAIGLGIIKGILPGNLTKLEYKDTTSYYWSYSWQEVNDFLGLSPYESKRIFDYVGYLIFDYLGYLKIDSSLVTPKMVASKIRQFISHKVAEELTRDE